jgi:hypothetical protein
MTEAPSRPALAAPSVVDVRCSLGTQTGCQAERLDVSHNDLSCTSSNLFSFAKHPRRRLNSQSSQHPSTASLDRQGVTLSQCLKAEPVSLTAEIFGTVSILTVQQITRGVDVVAIRLKFVISPHAVCLCRWRITNYAFREGFLEKRKRLLPRLGGCYSSGPRWEVAS